MIPCYSFAGAKSLAGRDALELPLEPRDDRRTANRSCCRMPYAATITRASLWAVDGEYAKAETIVTTKSEVALIPPVSGGDVAYVK